MTLCSPGFLRQLRWLACARQGAARGAAPRKGPLARWARTEEVEHRDYSPGDDYRQVDWIACARSDELLTRRTAGNADRRVEVLVDCSRSMATGGGSKLDVARRIAAMVGAAALGHSAQLAITAFAHRIVAELPPRRARGSWLEMARFLDGLSPQGSATDLARAARTLVGRRRRSGLAVIVGDFLEPSSYARGLAILRSRGHELHVVHVCDRRDAGLELLGDVELCDVESGARWAAVVRERDLRRYRACYEQHLRAVRRACLRLGAGYHRIDTHAPLERVAFDLTGLRVPTYAPGSLRSPLANHGVCSS